MHLGARPLGARTRCARRLTALRREDVTSEATDLVAGWAEILRRRSQRSRAWSVSIAFIGLGFALMYIAPRFLAATGTGWLFGVALLAMVGALMVTESRARRAKCPRCGDYFHDRFSRQLSGPRCIRCGFDGTTQRQIRRPEPKAG
jgi:hypothetical protein